jgi:hypothetical protein
VRRWLASWVLVCVCVAGCIDRQRVNRTCDWTGDATFPLDLLNPADRQHLIEDGQLAEELAIRYADAEHKRRFGTEAHGGLLDHGRVRNECMARLVAAIESDHAVAAEQIDVARAQRSPAFDLAAGLSFLPIYSLGVIVICRGVHRRFSSDRRNVELAVTGVTSVAASLVGLQLGQLWLSVWEVIRVGNGHMSSFRAASSTHWGHQHVGAVLIGGIALFWLIALLCQRARSSDEPSSTDAHAPQGILLR